MRDPNLLKISNVTVHIVVSVVLGLLLAPLIIVGVAAIILVHVLSAMLFIPARIGKILVFGIFHKAETGFWGFIFGFVCLSAFFALLFN